MSSEERLQRRAAASAELNRHEGRTDGERVVALLADGLSTLRELFLTRVHADVEQVFGADSMIVNVSALKMESQARAEIDLYLVAEAAAVAREYRYVVSEEPHWCRDWLARLRLGVAADATPVTQRLAQYETQSSDSRRRMFSSLLERVLPVARRSPLLVYRLFPFAVQIATSLAFGDHGRAADARRAQIALLPAIGDCHQCHGHLMDLGEACQQCGNPFWKTQWMNAD